MGRDEENMRDELTQPLTTVWKVISNLNALSTEARLPYLDGQLVNIALTIIKSTHDFENGLSE